MQSDWSGPSLGSYPRKTGVQFSSLLPFWADSVMINTTDSNPVILGSTPSPLANFPI